MSIGITKLPLELLSEIIRNVSEEDLCQLRSVNSTFNTLTTPAAFASIIVWNDKQVAERFLALLNTPHIARHVQSIEYDEYTCALAETMTDVKVWEPLDAAFSNLHLAPSLKSLALHFDVHYTGRHRTGEVYSHQSGIFLALGKNRNRLPKLQSLEIRGLLDLCNPVFTSLFDKAPITWLTSSLRHLDFFLPCGTTGPSSEESVPRKQFWKKVVLRRILRPAVNLESLAISECGSVDEAHYFDVSQAQLATYPRLTALSLSNIIWEDGTIGQRGVVTPSSVEDFIVRHSKTLKKLKLYHCTIMVKDYGRQPPVCYWADIYKRLANALTELVDLEVNNYDVPYVSTTGPPGCLIPFPYYHLKRLEGMERDAEALKEFEAVVKNRWDGR